MIRVYTSHLGAIWSVRKPFLFKSISCDNVAVLFVRDYLMQFPSMPMLNPYMWKVVEV